MSQLKGVISISGNAGPGFNQTVRLSSYLEPRFDARTGLKVVLLQDVEILCRHSYDSSFDSSSMASSREALKCLANVLLLESKTRRMFVDLGYANKAAIELKVNLLLGPSSVREAKVTSA